MKKIIYILNLVAYGFIFQNIFAMKIPEKPTWNTFHKNNSILVNYKKNEASKVQNALRFMKDLAKSDYKCFSLKARIALGSHYMIAARSGGAGADTFYRNQAIEWLIPVANQNNYQYEKFIAAESLGSIYQYLGDIGKAKKWYEEAVKIGVTDNDLKFKKTKILQELKKLK